MSRNSSSPTGTESSSGAKEPAVPGETGDGVTSGGASASNRLYWLGVAVLVAYGVFTWWLIKRVDGDEIAWTRLVFLHGGVEAVVFAAVGGIYGTAVQRSRAEKAEAEVKSVKKEGEGNRIDAEAGRSLYASVKGLQSVSSREEEAPPVGDNRISGPPTLVQVKGIGDTLDYLSRVWEFSRRPPA